MLIGMLGSMWMGLIVMVLILLFMFRLRGMIGRMFVFEEKLSRFW